MKTGSKKSRFWRFVLGPIVNAAILLFCGQAFAYHPVTAHHDDTVTAADVNDWQYNFDYVEANRCVGPGYVQHVWSSEFPVAQGTVIKAVHINEIRAQIRHIYTAKCYASIPGNSVFGADAVSGSTPIKAGDFMDAVAAMDYVWGINCASSCAGSLCSNSTLDAGEACDDGNAVNGDGCSSTCQCEYNWVDAGGCGDAPCLPTQKPQSGTSSSAQCAPTTQCAPCAGCVNSGTCSVDTDCCSGVCYSDGVCQPAGGDCGPSPHYLMSGGSCEPSCGHLGNILGKAAFCCTSDGCRTSSLGTSHDCGGGAWCCDATGLPEAVNACAGCGNNICDMNAPDNDGCGCADCSSDPTCSSCTDPSTQCSSWINNICGGPVPTAPGRWSEKCNDGGPCDGAIRATSNVCCTDECSVDTECGSDAGLCDTTSECSSPSGGRIFVGHCNPDASTGCNKCATTVCQQACP